MERCPTCAMPVKVVGKTTKHYEPDLSKLEVEVDETKLKSIIYEHVLIFEDGFYESDKEKNMSKAIVNSKAFKIKFK